MGSAQNDPSDISNPERVPKVWKTPWSLGSCAMLFYLTQKDTSKPCTWLWIVSCDSRSNPGHEQSLCQCSSNSVERRRKRTGVEHEEPFSFWRFDFESSFCAVPPKSRHFAACLTWLRLVLGHIADSSELRQNAEITDYSFQIPGFRKRIWRTQLHFMLHDGFWMFLVGHRCSIFIHFISVVGGAYSHHQLEGGAGSFWRKGKKNYILVKTASDFLELFSKTGMYLQ